MKKVAAHDIQETQIRLGLDYFILYLLSRNLKTKI